MEKKMSEDINWIDICNLYEEDIKLLTHNVDILFAEWNIYEEDIIKFLYDKNYEFTKLQIKELLKHNPKALKTEKLLELI
jgi:nicotinic acid phosphoribosyltransferase